MREKSNSVDLGSQLLGKPGKSMKTSARERRWILDVVQQREEATPWLVEVESKLITAVALPHLFSL